MQLLTPQCGKLFVLFSILGGSIQCFTFVMSMWYLFVIVFGSVLLFKSCFKTVKISHVCIVYNSVQRQRKREIVTVTFLFVYISLFPPPPTPPSLWFFTRSVFLCNTFSHCFTTITLSFCNSVCFSPFSRSHRSAGFNLWVSKPSFFFFNLKCISICLVLCWWCDSVFPAQTFFHLPLTTSINPSTSLFTFYHPYWLNIVSGQPISILLAFYSGWTFGCAYLNLFIILFFFVTSTKKRSRLKSLG